MVFEARLRLSQQSFSCISIAVLEGLSNILGPPSLTYLGPSGFLIFACYVGNRCAPTKGTNAATLPSILSEEIKFPNCDDTLVLAAVVLPHLIGCLKVRQSWTPEKEKMSVSVIIRGCL